MKFDIEKAIKAPFSFKNEADWIYIYLIAAVLSFFGYFSFSFNSQGSSHTQFKRMFSKLYEQITSDPVLMTIAVVIIILIVILLIIKIFASCTIWGYLLDTIKLELNDSSYIMPNWGGNIFRFFKKGFIICFVRYLYTFIFLLIPTILILPAFYLLHVSFPSSMNPDEFLSFLLSPVIIASIFLWMFSLIIFAFLQPFIIVNYAEKCTFWSCFDLVHVISKLFQNFIDFLLIILIQIPLVIVLMIVNIALCCTCVGSLLIPLTSAFIYQIVVLNMFTQIYKD